MANCYIRFAEMIRFLVVFTLFVGQFHACFAKSDSTHTRFFSKWWISAGYQFAATFDGSTLQGLQFGYGCVVREKHRIDIRYHRAVTPFKWGNAIAPYRLAYDGYCSLTYGQSVLVGNRATIVGYAGLGFGHYVYWGKHTGFSSSFFESHQEYETDAANYAGLVFGVQLPMTGPQAGIRPEIYVNVHRYCDFGFQVTFLLGCLKRDSDSR